jgi:hypothetical protein
MSYKSLLNTTCSWQRKSSTSQGTYYEQEVTLTTVASGISCRVEPLYIKEMQELGMEGEIGKKYERIFFLGVVDIKQGDIVTVSGQSGVRRTVVDTGDAGGHGHHTEAILEKVNVE